jgi:hypothetical protein
MQRGCSSVPPTALGLFVSSAAGVRFQLLVAGCSFLGVRLRGEHAGEGSPGVKEEDLRRGGGKGKSVEHRDEE